MNPKCAVGLSVIDSSLDRECSWGVGGGGWKCHPEQWGLMVGRRALFLSLAVALQVVVRVIQASLECSMAFCSR